MDERPMLRLDLRPSARTYVLDLIRARELIVAIAWTNVRTRHGKLALGWAWNLLDPLLMLGVYWLVFGTLLAGRRPQDFLAFLAVGSFLFRFVQSTVTAGSSSLHRNLGMLRQMRFPRAVLPASETLESAIVLLLQLPVVAGIVIVSSGRVRPGWIVLLVVLIPLLATFSLGCALLVARVAHRIVDFTKVLPYLFRILFYGSGVLFPIDTILDGHPLEAWLPVNPLYVFVTLGRHLVIEPREDVLLLWASVVVWTVASITVGLAVFLRAEQRYGRG